MWVSVTENKKYYTSIYNPEIKETHFLNFTYTFILLSLSYFRSYDWFEARDGPNEDSPLIGKLCGSNLPGTVVSTGNEMFVKFHSDYSEVGRGYEAKADAGGPSRWN